MSERESMGGNNNVDPLGGLILDPSNELKFKGPFDDYVTVSLTIRNPTDKRVAFKIKTTAPKRYCVKPNSGVLKFDETAKINVLLQPFQYDPNEKNKHKFMVQYLYLNESEMQLSVDAILNKWKDFPASRLLDLKLKCIFDFTEAEQSRLPNLQQVSDSTVIPSSKDSSAAKSDTHKQSHSTTSSSNSSMNQGVTKANSDTFSTAVDSNDFDSSIVKQKVTNTSNSNTNSPNTNTSITRPEKNDNTINELKLLKQENEMFKKEITRLKDEEARLRKLALQTSSPSASTQRSSNPGELADILSNRLILVIVGLIAIIIYLILFR